MKTSTAQQVADAYRMALTMEREGYTSAGKALKDYAVKLTGSLPAEDVKEVFALLVKSN